MKWLHFILSHSIFISVCASALCFQTHQLLNIETNIIVYILVFSTTLAGYNLYWLISKFFFSNRDIAKLLKTNISNLFVLFLASLSSIICIIREPYLIIYLIVASVLTLLYSLPLWPIHNNRLLPFMKGYFKTILLSFTWAYATVIIPVAGNDVNISSIIILFIARFAFMLMLCSIFDSRDIGVDKLHGLRSLATDVSAKALRILMLITFSIYIIAGLLLRINFTTQFQVLAFIITGIITLYVYYLSIKKRNYFFYYFLVDGLMLISSLLTFVASID